MEEAACMEDKACMEEACMAVGMEWEVWEECMEEARMGWAAWEECMGIKVTKEDSSNELRCIYSNFVKLHRWLNAMRTDWQVFTQL